MGPVDFLVLHQETVLAGGLAAIAVLTLALKRSGRLGAPASRGGRGGRGGRGAARRGKGKTQGKDVDALLKEGRYVEAAQVAQESGRLVEAIDLLIRVHLLGR